MSKQCTKALGNRYYEARMKAAKYNEKLFTRAGAAECLPGVTEECLKKYELDINRPPNTVVSLMADEYGQPELRQWYCANECPLGKTCRDMPEMPAERALLRLQNSIRTMNEPMQELSLIMEDGKIDEVEMKSIPRIYEQLLEVKKRIDENLIVLEKAAHNGEFN